MNKRREILEDNRQRRLGNRPVRRLDDGYVAFKIPTYDYKVLCMLFPELISKDPVIRLAAWKNFEDSELGEKYRVTQHSPNQVKRISKHGNKGIIIK